MFACLNGLLFQKSCRAVRVVSMHTVALNKAQQIMKTSANKLVWLIISIMGAETPVISGSAVCLPI